MNVCICVAKSTKLVYQSQRLKFDAEYIDNALLF